MQFKVWLEQKTKPSVWSDGSGTTVVVTFPNGDKWKYTTPESGPVLGIQDFVTKNRFKPLTIANYLKNFVNKGYTKAIKLTQSQDAQ